MKLSRHGDELSALWKDVQSIWCERQRGIAFSYSFRQRAYTVSFLLKHGNYNGGPLRHPGSHPTIEEEATAVPAPSLGKMTGLD